MSACRGIGLDPETFIRGDVDDPRSTWLELPDGERRELVWPPLYVARFAPSLEVLDADQEVQFREGDRVHGACVKGPANDPASILLIQRTDRVE